MITPVTRRLGRTNREVTTLGLGGQASIQWPDKDSDPVAIIKKAHDQGITYMDTSNIYGPSQENYGRAFRRLGLSPAKANYDPDARNRIFVAGKTHIRTARLPEGNHFRSNYSEGMMDDFKVSTAVDDVHRALSLMFGDGKGSYPEGAYLDSIQFHNINTMDEVDMLFEGFDDPSPDRPQMGALAALLDLREGTNRTGCNPGRERLIRHIGISGHWNTAALMYAVRRDYQRVIDTLLVTINPSDHKYMAHRHNAIAAATEAGMGVIGMKLFADAAYYHKGIHFSSRPEDVYHDIGSKEIPSRDLIEYALSVKGIATVITGIGHIDTDPVKCQLEQNLAAAQINAPLSEEQMNRIEQMVAKAGKDSANAYFQRHAIGLTPPRNVGVEDDSAMTVMNHHAVRVRWDSAYAGRRPVDRYAIFCNETLVGEVAHTPQISETGFSFTHILDKDQKKGCSRYIVRAIDTEGSTSESGAVEINFS